MKGISTKYRCIYVGQVRPTRHLAIINNMAYWCSNSRSFWPHMIRAYCLLDGSKLAQVTGGPREPKVVGVKKLHNGGVVFELNNVETAQWVRVEKTAFTDNFGGTSLVREQAISVIVEYVPVAHNPDTLADNSRIEWDSSMTECAFLTTRWIKPVQRQAPGQHCTHLIMCFQTLEVANLAIRESIVIVGKRAWAMCM